jgi:hypothetical protein
LQRKIVTSVMILCLIQFLLVFWSQVSMKSSILTFILNFMLYVNTVFHLQTKTTVFLKELLHWKVSRGIKISRQKSLQSNFCISLLRLIDFQDTKLVLFLVTHNWFTMYSVGQIIVKKIGYSSKLYLYVLFLI